MEVSSIPLSIPINPLSYQNIFRELNDPYTGVTRLTRYEPHEALLAVSHNDLPRPSTQM